jgi:hypothetical protein
MVSRSTQANVSYDHPFNAPMEHALNIDFVNESKGTLRPRGGGVERVSRRGSWRGRFLEVLDRAEAGGHL